MDARLAQNRSGQCVRRRAGQISPTSPVIDVSTCGARVAL
jgi:hypothetical protein